MQNKARKNYIIYVLMLLLFGGLIYVAIEEGDRFSHSRCEYVRTRYKTESFRHVSTIYAR